MEAGDIVEIASFYIVEIWFGVGTHSRVTILNSFKHIQFAFEGLRLRMVFPTTCEVEPGDLAYLTSL